MASDPHTPGVNGRARWTPMRGTDYMERCATPMHNNLEGWLQDVSTGYPFRAQDVTSFCCIGVLSQQLLMKKDRFLQQNFIPKGTGETENVEVVRTFYTSRATSKSDVTIWYADVQFGFYEGLPKRVADLCATHVVVEVRSPNPRNGFWEY
jgi:hypothetical protein